jgi:hypothetical protein
MSIFRIFAQQDQNGDQAEKYTEEEPKPRASPGILRPQRTERPE